MITQIFELVNLARSIKKEIHALGFSDIKNVERIEDIYDSLISSKPIVDVSRKLFFDGHYAQSVEEAFKKIDNCSATIIPPFQRQLEFPFYLIIPAVVSSLG